MNLALFLSQGTVLGGAMRRFFCLMIMGVALQAGPVYADAQDGDGSAAIYVQRQNSTPMRWSGVGELRSQNDLCIVTQTGRFRLRLQIGGKQGRDAVPDFEVTFSTAAGDRLTRRSNESDVLIFEGRVTPVADCKGVVNANLQFRFTERELSAAIAGNYLQQLVISIEPV